VSSQSSALRTLLLVLYLTVLGGCAKHSPPPPPPPQVGVVNAEAAEVPLTRSLVGRLAPHFSANVTARISGVLVKRDYAEGSTVKQGQILFEIDPAYYQTVLNNYLAALAQDQASYVYDRLTAERDHKLLPVGSVSQQTVDDADAIERSAAARVQADAAAVQGARINLGYTKVSSPIDGIARQQQVTRGALVGAGTSDSGASGTLLATVDQIDSVYVNFTISAADLVTFRQAQSAGGVTLAQQDKTTVQIVLPNGSVYPQLGTLDFSDSAVNATTGAVNLRALVPNAQHELLPGLYVTLNVDFGRQRGVFLIPQQALQRDTVGAFLLVVGAGGKVLRKNVSADNADGTDWIVTSGLAAGDQVVVSGLQSIHEGGNATATPWQAKDAPPVQP
jgi:membrane fusion protein (multidrug efflux system)